MTSDSQNNEFSPILSALGASGVGRHEGPLSADCIAAGQRITSNYSTINSTAAVPLPGWVA